MNHAKLSSPGFEAPRAGKRFPVIAGHGAGRVDSRRQTGGHAILSITVSASQVLGVRRAVVALAHPALDLLTVTPLPGGSRVRVTAYLASAAIDRLTARILEFVTDRNPGAECARGPKHAEDAPRSEASATAG